MVRRAPIPAPLQRPVQPPGRLPACLAADLSGGRRDSAILVVLAVLNAGLVAMLVAGGGPGAVLLLAAGLALAVVFVYAAYPSLVARSVGARTPNPAEAARLVPIVRDLATRAGIRTPRILIADQTSPNAFAFGRGPNDGTIVFTSGLLARLDEAELTAVAAHEVSHIAGGDTRLALWSASLLGWVLLVSWIGLAIALGLIGAGIGMLRSPGRGSISEVIAAPVMGLLLICLAVTLMVALAVWVAMARLADLAIHRARESLADARASALTGHPEDLARALRSLDGQDVPLMRGAGLAGHLCVIVPNGGHSFWGDLMRSHPSTSARLARLAAYAAAMPRPAVAAPASPQPPRCPVRLAAAPPPPIRPAARPPAGPPAPPEPEGQGQVASEVAPVELLALV